MLLISCGQKMSEFCIHQSGRQSQKYTSTTGFKITYTGLPVLRAGRWANIRSTARGRRPNPRHVTSPFDGPTSEAPPVADGQTIVTWPRKSWSDGQSHRCAFLDKEWNVQQRVSFCHTNCISNILLCVYSLLIVYACALRVCTWSYCSCSGKSCCSSEWRSLRTEKEFAISFIKELKKLYPWFYVLWGFCLEMSVRNSVPVTNEVQYLKFGWWYSYQTLIISSSMGSSRDIYICT